MKTSDFNYDLPNELIADYPLESRSKSRLLVYMNDIEHKSFTDILDYFKSGDLLVLNNTSVIPARIFGKKDSGGLVEVLLERFMEDVFIDGSHMYDTDKIGEILKNTDKCSSKWCQTCTK